VTMGITVVLRAQGARDTALADVTSRLAGRSCCQAVRDQFRTLRLMHDVDSPEVLLAWQHPVAAWPFAARAQQPAMPVIGSLYGVSAAEWAGPMAGFRRGLSETGFVEGRNVVISLGRLSTKGLSASVF
jgi:hypothetical protein